MLLPFRSPDKPIPTTQEVVRKLPESSWLVQPKYNGWRMLAFIDSPTEIRCLSRVGRPMEDTGALFNPSIKDGFKEIKSHGHLLPAGTILDCEFIGPRGKLEPAIYIFDMLAWNGDWLANEPFEQRFERCRDLFLPDQMFHVVTTIDQDFLGLYNKLKTDWEETGNTLHEGIVLKSRKGKLKLNRASCADSSAMLKLKYRDNDDRRRY